MRINRPRTPAAGFSLSTSVSQQLLVLPRTLLADSLKSMRSFFTKHRILRYITSLGALILALFPCAHAAPSKDKTPPPTLRWAEGQAGCTFSRDDDGKYRYSLWTPDYGVILAVDSQELEKVHRRVEPFFSVELTIRYRGQGSLEFDAGKATIEFVRHYKVIQSSLDPESFAQKTQNDADEREHEAQREIEKHPERKEEREKFLQTYQKEISEFLDFVTKRTLTATTLDPSNPTASGWLMFSTQSKWIGSWKKPEEFVLRLPMPGRVLEFPFALPAEQGDLILRRRPQ
jgi:hypothetical protein